MAGETLNFCPFGKQLVLDDFQFFFIFIFYFVLSFSVFFFFFFLVA